MVECQADIFLGRGLVGESRIINNSFGRRLIGGWPSTVSDKSGELASNKYEQSSRRYREVV
jgi:hypothetical protein